jgi:cyclic pyranopterin phosphate synthase
MPQEGMQWLPREELLSYEEIARIARIMSSYFYVDSVRITGGEPTVRAGITRLVAMLSELKTPDGKQLDISMTTNGVLFPQLAHDLKQVGLKRVNISLDTLDRDRFIAITKRDQLARVVQAIEVAVQEGFSPVKVNMVVMRGVNDDEVVDFAEFGRTLGITVRFIEFMPLDGDQTWSPSKVFSASDILLALSKKYDLIELGHSSDPASLYRFADGSGEIGIIPTVTKPFCADCDRIRLTAEGQIRTCLFALEEHDLKTPLRSGSSDQEIAELLERIVGTKWAGHKIGNVNFVRPHKSMSQIGG